MKSLSSKLFEISRHYYSFIPLGNIFVACEDAGLSPVDEDGSLWEGFLCGDSGRASIALAESVLDVAGKSIKVGKVIKKALQIQWYRMPSGRFEVNAYVS